MADDIDLSFLDEGEEQEQEQAAIDPKKLGYALRQEQKARKSAEKELTELRAFQARVVEEQKVATLKAAGLNEFHSEAYLKFFPDVSEENLVAYKAKAGLEAPAEEPAPEPSGHHHTIVEGFPPTTGGQVPGTKQVTKADMEKVMRENPAAGWALLQSGKVKFTNLQE